MSKVMEMDSRSRLWQQQGRESGYRWHWIRCTAFPITCHIRKDVMSVEYMLRCKGYDTYGSKVQMRSMPNPLGVDSADGELPKKTHASPILSMVV